MPNTIDDAIAYAQAHPLRDGKSWAGCCESFIWRAGGFTRSFPSAMDAGDASGPLNPNWAAAPRGAIHYWAGVGGDGHVAFELGGGTLLMASSQVSNYGTALGTIHFTDYARLNIPYRGWTLRHGTETLAGTATAGGKPKPRPAPPIELELGMAQRMYFARIDGAGSDTGEWMIAGTDIPAHPTDPKQDGYRVTTDKEVAKVWARQYSFGPVATKAVRLTRDLYIKQQEFARRDAVEWRAGIRALLTVK